MIQGQEVLRDDSNGKMQRTHHDHIELHNNGSRSGQGQVVFDQQS